MSPYFIQGPALISFSGGRTSAYMLYQILQAHGGTLPPDVVVAFANTGKEREETLAFVHQCGSRWAVKVHWLEWRTGKPGFEEVGYNGASRLGEPFAALIARKRYVPNAVTRFCTSELKVRTIRRFCLSLGWTHWHNIVGLRYDEGRRVLKALANNDSDRERRFKTRMPMASAAAKVTKRDVMAFWAAQPFDLGLAPHEGNCDLCFLKARDVLKHIIRDDPKLANWWKAQEASIGAQFVTEYSYVDLQREISTQPFVPRLFDDSTEHDTECGLHCSA